jgi:hypothetical protein
MLQVEDVTANLKILRDQIWTTIASLNTTNPQPARHVDSESPWTIHSEYQAGRVPNFDQPWTLQNDEPAVKAFRSWSAKLLHLLLHKTYCVLYHPLMKSTDQLCWLTVREMWGALVQEILGSKLIRCRAIKHNHAFLQIFTQLCTDPMFEPFQWIYPGTYQPLQALSLLLADLLENPLSDEAPTSRGLIDATFALYRMDEGIVGYDDGQGHQFRKRNLSRFGKEAWSMLTNARRRALQQIGQDPHVLWPIHSGFPHGRCICGGNIMPALSQPQDHLGCDRHEDVGEPNLDGPFPLNIAMGNESFDWDEWDAILGTATGVFG